MNESLMQRHCGFNRTASWFFRTFVAVPCLLFVTGCATEIDEYEYQRVKEMSADVPALSEVVSKSFKDDKITEDEYDDIKHEYDRLKKQAVKNQIKESLQR